MEASYFTLKGKDEKEILEWINRLPLRLRAGQKELIILKCKRKKSVVWIKREGFIYFE